MQNSFLEKRKFPRFDYSTSMRYRALQDATQPFKGGLLKNISEGGINALIYGFVPLNVKLSIEIPLVCARPPIKGTCRVAWIKKIAYSEQYDIGIEFAGLNQGDKSNITNFIFYKNVEWLQ